MSFSREPNILSVILLICFGLALHFRLVLTVDPILSVSQALPPTVRNNCGTTNSSVSFSLIGIDTTRYGFAIRFSGLNKNISISSRIYKGISESCTYDFFTVTSTYAVIQNNKCRNYNGQLVLLVDQPCLNQSTILPAAYQIKFFYIDNNAQGSIVGQIVKSNGAVICNPFKQEDCKPSGLLFDLMDWRWFATSYVSQSKVKVKHNAIICLTVNGNVYSYLSPGSLQRGYKEFLTDQFSLATMANFSRSYNGADIEIDDPEGNSVIVNLNYNGPMSLGMDGSYLIAEEDLQEFLGNNLESIPGLNQSSANSISIHLDTNLNIDGRASSNGMTCTDNCGFHHSLNISQYNGNNGVKELFYGIVSSPSRTSCTGCLLLINNNTYSYTDIISIIATHEISEVITKVALQSNYIRGVAEIADLCSWYYQTLESGVVISSLWNVAYESCLGIQAINSNLTEIKNLETLPLAPINIHMPENYNVSFYITPTDISTSLRRIIHFSNNAGTYPGGTGVWMPVIYMAVNSTKLEIGLDRCTRTNWMQSDSLPINTTTFITVINVNTTFQILANNSKIVASWTVPPSCYPYYYGSTYISPGFNRDNFPVIPIQSVSVNVYSGPVIRPPNPLLLRHTTAIDRFYYFVPENYNITFTLASNIPVGTTPILQFKENLLTKITGTPQLPQMLPGYEYFYFALSASLVVDSSRQIVLHLVLRVRNGDIHWQTHNVSAVIPPSVSTVQSISILLFNQIKYIAINNNLIIHTMKPPFQSFYFNSDGVLYDTFLYSTGNTIFSTDAQGVLESISVGVTDPNFIFKKRMLLTYIKDIAEIVDICSWYNGTVQTKNPSVWNSTASTCVGSQSPMVTGPSIINLTTLPLDAVNIHMPEKYNVSFHITPTNISTSLRRIIHFSNNAGTYPGGTGVWMPVIYMAINSTKLEIGVDRCTRTNWMQSESLPINATTFVTVINVNTTFQVIANNSKIVASWTFPPSCHPYYYGSTYVSPGFNRDNFPVIPIQSVSVNVYSGPVIRPPNPLLLRNTTAVDRFYYFVPENYNITFTLARNIPVGTTPLLQFKENFLIKMSTLPQLIPDYRYFGMSASLSYNSIQMTFQFSTFLRVNSAFGSFNKSAVIPKSISNLSSISILVNRKIIKVIVNNNNNLVLYSASVDPNSFWFGNSIFTPSATGAVTSLYVQAI